MRVTELDVADDHFLVVRSEARERRPIARAGLRTNGAVEGRRFGIDKRVRQHVRRSPARETAVLVANTISDGLAQIRCERTLTPRFEDVEAPERAKERVLDEVRRIGCRAGPPGKPAVSPSAN